MKQLYEGKTKNVMLDEETNVVSLFFKDSATGENGVFRVVSASGAAIGDVAVGRFA
mgnify:CR=1 FL=1